jgi:excisionase family DNA binding protein
MKKMKTKHFLTSKEAAKKLGYSLSNINYLIQDGKLFPTKVYGRNLFTEDELKRFESLQSTKRNKFLSHE